VVLFIVWLSQAGGDQDKKYDIFFKQAVDGLAKGSAVTFSGVPVGQIESINLEPRATPEFIRVRITTDEQDAGARSAPPRRSRASASPASRRSSSIRRTRARGSAAAPAGRDRCPEENPAQCPYGVPVIPTKPGALGQLLNSAPELLERVSTLTERLTELLSDRNQESIAAILENVQVISRNLAERSDEIAATLAEARIAIRQTGDAVEQMGRLAGTTNQTLERDARPLINDLRPDRPRAETSMKNLDAAIGDARPGVQAFSKQTMPEVGQLVRDLREMSNALSAVSQRLDQQGAGGSSAASAARLSSRMKR
jgi:phospholipid/cholesterol/gamma-HCH transport system substrate-binding protein